jgi:predicted phage tail protein
VLTIIFYGELRARFGRRFVLDVRSPREAVHALCVQIRGLPAWFRDHGAQQFLVRGPHQDYDEHDIHYPISTGVLKIVPLVQGTGSWGKVIAGIGLIAIGVISGGTLAPAIISMGLALAMGGVSQMLAPRQSGTATPEKADNTPNLAFDGAVNTMGQGGPVPLGYGRLIIGSQIISVGFSTNNEIMVN